MTGGAREFVALAPAKVNLVLAVVERRDDGFHELDTVMAALDWCDRLSIDPNSAAPPLVVTGPMNSPDIPLDEANLVVRTARAVAALVDADAPNFVLEKELPSMAGLGGGSADAAAAAWLTARHLGLDPDAEAVRAVVASVGSDASFFLEARATGVARCRGRGEIVEPIELELPGWISLITPAVSVSTPAVFGALRPSDWSGAIEPFNGWQSNAEWTSTNDLEVAAERVEPELVVWREALDETPGGRWLLSGSGSSYFAMHLSREAAEEALAAAVIAGKARDLGLRAQRVCRLRRAGVGAFLTSEG